MMKLAGFAVHLFTGLGAVCALFAVMAVFDASLGAAFLWLGAAFLIDGLDGPLARAVDVKAQLPRFSGEVIDLVIDYLTYVFVPVLLLVHEGRLPAGVATHGLAALILLSSLFHFADAASKARDLAFVGFPAIWNVVAFYVFALDLGHGTTALLVLVCVAATFVPMHWVHPVRVVPLRPVTLSLTAVWAIAAFVTALNGFPAETWAQAALVGVALYGLGVSAWLSRRGNGTGADAA